MEIIGVLGGVASGKSAVAKIFESLGAVRLDADAAGHVVLEDPVVVKALTDRWGQRVVDKRGKLDRGAIGHIVFAKTPEAANELEFLESITHPRIAERLEAQLAQAGAEGHPAAVLDAAVMLKAGWNQLCNRLVFVEVSESHRLSRALKRGWTREEFESREAAQYPLSQKVQIAKTIVDNSGPLEETLKQVRVVWSTWLNERD